MKTFSNIKLQQGFSLVEVLVYIFIFTLVSAGALGLLFSLNDLFVQYKLKQSLFSSGTAMMERLLLEVRESDSLVIAQSQLASSTAGVITLEKYTNLTKVEKVGDELYLSFNDVLEGSLHASDVEIIGATFYHYEYGGVEMVRIRLDLRATAGSQVEEWSVTGGAIIRGSYAST